MSNISGNFNVNNQPHTCVSGGIEYSQKISQNTTAHVQVHGGTVPRYNYSGGEVRAGLTWRF